MLVENNWIKSNIANRKINNRADINLDFNVHEFTPVKLENPSKEALIKRFHLQSNETCKKLKELDCPLYLAFSGGMDSDYVFTKLVENDVKFTPIIISTDGNLNEEKYAFRRCRYTNIEPIVVNKSEKDLIYYWYDNVWKDLKSTGYNSIPILWAAEVAKQNGGKLIIGEHLLLYFEPLILGYSDWDFYTDYYYGEDSCIPFFLYDPGIAYATHYAIKDPALSAEKEEELKWMLYEIDFRPKFKYVWSNMFYQVCGSLIKKEESLPKLQTTIETDLFFNMLEEKIRE